MGFFRNKNTGRINESELSDKIKPIYESAHAICREFGYEDGRYFDYRYKDQSINIQHTSLEKSTSVDAFSPGKYVKIEYKGQCVFDCLIKLNGDIKLKAFESGEWTTYFSSLQRTLKFTLLARDKLSQYYKFSDMFFVAARDKKIQVNNSSRYVYQYGRIKINYDINQGYTFEDDKIKIIFNRDEKRNIASAADVTFMGRTVFNAVHYFPSNQRPFSSNTHCNTFERGDWEDYLLSAFNGFKTSHRL